MEKPQRRFIGRIETHYRETGPDRKTRAAVLVSLVVAAAMRLLFASWKVPDLWGDAYHHWLISRLTLEHDWTYVDYKGLEVIWLPGYHYLVAVAMAIWGRFDLAPAHVTNFLVGTLSCGLVTWLVADATRGWRVGLGAGLTLALLPWHVAYSHINMPEVFAGLLLSLILMAARRRSALRLASLALVGALTRHELTLLMPVICVWLAGRKHWRAAWAAVLGSSGGLVLWSLWSQHITGDPLAWWVRSREATAWDARFWSGAGVRLDDLATLAGAAQRAYPPVVLVGLVTLAAVLLENWRRRVPVAGWLLIALVGFHWLALGLGFAAGNLPSADPRYLLVSLPPLAGAGVIVIAASPYRQFRLALAASYVALIGLSLSHPLSSFRGMDYVLAPERRAGEVLGRVAPSDGSFWVDAPVAIYHSQLGLERFFSSDRLLGRKSSGPESPAHLALAAIDAHDIRIVLWEDVPYSRVQYLWPQMAEGLAFSQGSYRFEPLYRDTGWELDYGARPTIIWRIIPLDSDVPLIPPH